MTNTAPTTPSAKLQYKQQANPLLSMQNYTPLVISGNDNKKYAANIIKPTQTGITCTKFLHYEIVGAR